MPLAELSHFHDSVPIIPESGLQFLDFGIRVGKDQTEMPERWGFYADKAWALTGKDLPQLVQREVPGGASGTGRVTCEVDLKDIETLFGDQWMPLPLFRRDLSGSFFRGPTNWARVFLHRLTEADADGNTHRVTVSLDTRLIPFIEEEAYVAPSSSDAKNGRPFALPSYRDPIDWYLQEEWVRDWCIEAGKDVVEKRERAAAKGRSVPTPTIEEVQAWMVEEGKPMLHLAAYRAYLDWLHSSGVLPAIVIVDRATEGHAAPIDVDLVLDLGNSRTCGLLIEADPSETGADITNAVKLKLRDLSRPYNVYTDPFASRIEFSRASFGRDHLSLRSGLADRFSWPSIVRVGPEASRLAGLRRGSEGASGLSSPKRYLWDEDARRDSWRFNSPFISGEQSDIATGVAFTTLVNDKGEALHRMETGPGMPLEDSFPSIRALYARRNLMSFTLAEIILQALCMMNSAAHRVRRAANERLPRRLRRLIMTMPTAMPLAERQILTEQAEAACELAYMALGLAWREQGADGRPAVHYASDVRRSADQPTVGPEVRLQWDEASATQAIYFYTQIAVNYSGDARAFFDSMRHPVNKSDPAMKDALRVATLDIGGGTTDLVITRLDVDGRGANVTVSPTQEFREGFNLAGDDAVQQVVREHVLPPLRKRLADGPLGADGAESILSQLFGGDRGDMKVIEQLRRQQFATQIAAPIAIALLSTYEQNDPQNPPALERRPFSAFFNEGDGLPMMLVDYVNAEVRKAGDPAFNLLELEIPIDVAEIDRTVREAFSEMMQALGEMVWRFRCDVLLVSGRPSRLPAIAKLLWETACLPPARIIPLHRFRVGGWYPFRDARATIADPKTTAAVGAMICLLSEGQLPNFNFRADLLRPASTARFFGKLDRGSRLLKDDEFFTDMHLEDTDWPLPETGVEFRGPMPLGFRQMAADWWPATRLYNLAYADNADISSIQQRTPLTVRLRRDKSGDKAKRVVDKFLIGKIEDRDGRSVPNDQLRLRLQTIDNQLGYWLDTGILLDQ
ncbi:virulence factor SrfB [Lacibacterium aquatile]|uniref:Virulence factor SrfB n=1 Tax=Lacibacterium aquatile TaxID=1168082 RepID=A0ABW5DZ07_9PROT